LFLVEEGNYFRNAFQVKEDKNNAKGKEIVLLIDGMKKR
jgi:hypothetical protein